MWRRVAPTGFRYSEETFNITVVEMPSVPSEYRCIVAIYHSSTVEVEYELLLPEIILTDAASNKIYSNKMAHQPLSSGIVCSVV